MNRLSYESLRYRFEDDRFHDIGLVCIRAAVIVSLLFLFLMSHFGVAYVVGSSMEPSYHDREIIFYRKTQDVGYEDVIIAFCEPLDELVIKRVIGVADDTIEISDGVTYRNEAPVVETNIVLDEEDNMIPTVVPEGELFLMGDNRPVSLDSRSDRVATFQIDDVCGVVLAGICF